MICIKKDYVDRYSKTSNVLLHFLEYVGQNIFIQYNIYCFHEFWVVVVVTFFLLQGFLRSSNSNRI